MTATLPARISTTMTTQSFSLLNDYQQHHYPNTTSSFIQSVMLPLQLEHHSVTYGKDTV